MGFSVKKVGRWRFDRPTSRPRPTNFDPSEHGRRTVFGHAACRCAKALVRTLNRYRAIFFSKKKKRKNCVLYANFQWEFLQKFEKTIFNEKYYLVERTFAKWRATWPNLDIIGRRTEVGRWRIKVGRSNRHRPTFLALNPIEN